jgi:hypothetical protein
VFCCEVFTHSSVFLDLKQRRIASLHQNTAIGSTDITDLWEPLEEGLLPLETTRHVSMITITLSTKELDKTSTGYQPPLPADQVKAMGEFDYEGGMPSILDVYPVMSAAQLLAFLLKCVDRCELSLLFLQLEWLMSV